MHGGDKRVAGGNEIQDDRATVFAVQARSIQFWLSDITVSTRRMPRAQKNAISMGKMIQQAPQSVFPARKRIGEYPAPSRIVRTASRHPPLPWKRLCIGCIQGWCQR